RYTGVHHPLEGLVHKSVPTHRHQGVGTVEGRQTGHAAAVGRRLAGVDVYPGTGLTERLFQAHSGHRSSTAAGSRVDQEWDVRGHLAILALSGQGKESDCSANTCTLVPECARALRFPSVSPDPVRLVGGDGTRPWLRGC